MKTKRILILVITILFYCVLTSDVVTAEPPTDTPSNNLCKLLKSGKLDVHFRSYYLNRRFSEPRTERSMAVGGWLGYETPSFHGLSACLVGYTSQGLIFTNPDQDGARLLAPGQKGYTVLGQAYAQFEIDKIKLKAYRQQIDTPFINPHDVRMTPLTFEAYTLEYTATPKLSFMASYVTKMKDWNNSSFKSMSEAAGYPGSNDSVTMGGVIFIPHDRYKFQFWNYYCHEFMNVIYIQGDARWDLTDSLSLTGSIQAFDQQDVGKAIAGNFHTGMGGLQAVAGWRGLDITLGFTITSKGHDMINPWGAYPGWTSIMEEDCDLAGEKAWVVGLAYDFEHIGIKGLSAFTNHTSSYVPPGGWFSSTDQAETDFTIDYHFPGTLKGLWLRLRTAYVNNSFDTGGEDYHDYRAIINYNF